MQIANPPVVDKVDAPLRFGLLGTSWIAITAVINTAKSHPEVVVAAVASRDKSKGEKYARKHAIPTVYSGADGYQGKPSLRIPSYISTLNGTPELLDDTSIDAVYNAVCCLIH